MHRFPLVATIICLFSVGCAAADDSGPAAVAQRLFDAMSSHDVTAARSLFTPEAMLTSVKRDQTAVSVPHEKWLEHLGTSKDQWLERMWNSTVLTHGTIAVVWGEYDFHLNGKFHHCGVDSFDLVKTGEGWKIAGIMDTNETSGCSPSPLGPPQK